MTLISNKTLIQQFTDAHNSGDLKKVREFLAPDFKAHISDWPKPLMVEEYLAGLEMAHQAFSNLFFTIEDLVVENDKVSARILARGKHTGEYFGIAPTDREVRFAAMAIRRIANGKIVEEWQVNDQLSLLQQLGFLY